MFKKILLSVFLLVVLPGLVFSQSSGKLAGIVKDKTTGEPLPGVNVVVEGTTMGSATDVDGYYVILNVPVGVYSLRASYIGYKDVVIGNVRVSANITSEVNFELEPTTLELEEAIVVTAERPLVEKHVTQSISLVTSEDIENLPIRGFQTLVATGNSVIIQDGNVHIRGGRDDEVGYYIDGASSINPLTNTNAVYVIQEAIEEFQVLSGGYTAEFGGHNSGIVRAELRTGSPDYHLSVDFQTDKFAGQGEKFLGTYSYQHHVAVATLSGPLGSKKIRFFLAGENNFRGDRQVRFSRGFTIDDFFAPDVPKADRLLIDTNPENSNVAAGHPDTIRAFTYPAGFTPHNQQNRYSLNGTLLFDYQPIRVRVSGSYTNRRTFVDSSPMLNLLNNRNRFDDYWSLLLSTKITHILSPKTFYDVRLSYYSSKLERKDDYFDEDWQKWYDSLAVAQVTGGKVIYRERWRPQFDYRFNGFPFMRDGDPSNFYRIQKQNYIGAAIDFVSQAHRYHEVKIGADFRKYTLRRFSIRPSIMTLLEDFNVSKITDIPIETWKAQSRVNNYGYDIYGNEADDDAFTTVSGKKFQTADAPKEPLFFAFYVQDKIEFNDLIINAGLRFDYFDSDDRKLKNPSNPKVDPNTSTFPPDAWEELDAFTQVSPRLGFSFPVSEKTVFYLQYGKFIQMPELETVYAGSNIYDFQYIQAGFAFLNPIGFGLEPIRTTSYEIGFRQQIGSRAAFDISGYYKNVKGQIQADKQFLEAGSLVPAPYNILVNRDFATTKGLDLRLTLRRTNRLQAMINYTLTDARGTGSTRTAFIGAVERTSPRPTIIQPLNFSQKHTGTIFLDYRFGKNDGGPILSQLGANILFSFSSGHPFTFAAPLPGGQTDPYTAGTDYMLDTRSRKATEALGSSTTPWVFNVDLRVDKTFNLLEDLQATVYMRITNLFNRKNVINVFESTGAADDDGFISNRAISQSTIDANGGDSYVRMYQIINIDNGQAYWNQLGRQLYGSPRQIFFGIKLNY